MKTSRRKFIESGLKATAIATLGTPFIISTAKASGESSNEGLGPVQFSQIALPYAYNALEPHIDAQTMEIHYTKHHTAYIKNVNEAIAAESVKFENEKDFFANVSKLSPKLRNNGGGAWNHNFFWQVMKPGASGTPYGKIVTALDGAFGSVPKFIEQFNAAALSRFGSGWVWLIKDSSGKLQVSSTPNQDNPLMDTADVKGTPLLALDVWEHAYYLKYQNKRAEYVTNWWNVVNWDEVAKRLNP